jgi:alkylhydroperoxidase family enzyme
MATSRGLLPKANRDELDERQQRRLERWYETGYKDDNLFLTLARSPELMDAVFKFIGFLYGGSSVEPDLFELVRIKLAWSNQCTHCSLVRSESVVCKWDDVDAMVMKLVDYENSDLPDRTKAALRLADRMTQPEARLEQSDYDDVRRFFSDKEILDLGMSIAFSTGFSRFIEGFGIVPDEYKEGAAKPWEIYARSES